MKIRKILKEVFDIEALEKNIQMFNDTNKQQAQLLANISNQVNDLKKEQIEKQKLQQQQALQQKKSAQQTAQAVKQNIASTNQGVGTKLTINPPQEQE